MPCGPVAIETSVWELVLVEGSVNEPCVQEVSGNDITAGGGGSAARGLLLLSDFYPRLLRIYATVTHVPFSKALSGVMSS